MRFRILIALCCASTLVAAEGLAPIFPTPTYFRKHFINPTGKVDLQPPVRLGNYVVSGKLELSLRSYLDLVMANNPDIAVQKLHVELQEDAVVRAFGVFDPILNASFSSTRAKTPSSDLLQGATTLNQLTQPATFGYSQELENGTQFNVGFAGEKTSNNSAFQSFNPALTGQLQFGFIQPLLRGRGGFITRLPITIARSKLRQSHYSMKDGIIQLVVTAETAYWQLVQARENLRVQEEALKLNNASLKQTQRELELGASSPLDIYQPEADYATAQINVSQAKYSVQQAEDALRRQMGADLDPQAHDLPIVLTEPVTPPTATGAIDRERAVEKALANRPDYMATRQSLDIDDLGLKQTADSLRPSLSLFGTYLSAGQGGPYYQRQNVFSGTGQSSEITQMIPGGFGDAISQIFNFGFPTYEFGVQLRLPIRDHAAQANYADAVVNKRLDALRVRSLELRIRQQVLNAVSQVESSKDAVKLSIVNRDLAQKVLDAEQKKYELGVSTIFFVLQAQRGLATANSLLVQQSTTYWLNMLNLLQMTGELLDERGIAVQ